MILKPPDTQQTSSRRQNALAVAAEVLNTTRGGFADLAQRYMTAMRHFWYPPAPVTTQDVLDALRYHIKTELKLEADNDPAIDATIMKLFAVTKAAEEFLIAAGSIDDVTIEPVKPSHQYKFEGDGPVKKFVLGAPVSEFNGD